MTPTQKRQHSLKRTDPRNGILQRRTVSHSLGPDTFDPSGTRSDSGITMLK